MSQNEFFKNDKNNEWKGQTRDTRHLAKKSSGRDGNERPAAFVCQ